VRARRAAVDGRGVQARGRGLRWRGQPHRHVVDPLGSRQHPCQLAACPVPLVLG
jgi:hypothetical protein